MGRSVSYPTGALVCFEDIGAFEGEFYFEWFTDDLKERAAAMFPSLYDCDKWRGREDHILMRNPRERDGPGLERRAATPPC